jgi:hypothetical protein
MAYKPVNPAELEGEELETWYRRTPDVYHTPPKANWRLF